MSDSDPISDSTPNKRRKLTEGKAWDSQDDSGEEFTADDFNTIATIPLGETQKRRLDYTKDQFHSDIRTSQPSRTYITQPTQALTLGSQATQSKKLSEPRTSEVQVERSSPPATSSPKPPIRRAFQNPNGRGLLASAIGIAPPGTTFRPPPSVQSKSSRVTIDLDDSDEDPPVHHSSDDEQPTQGLRSNLKPTAFTKGGRGLDSTPNRSTAPPIVKESPRPAAPVDTFRSLLSEFSYDASRPPSDSVSSYANSSRVKPQQARQFGQAKALPTKNAVIYNTVDDISDYLLRKKVFQILEVLPHETVQRCMDALKRKHGNVADAQEWLTADEEQDAPGEDDEESADELLSSSPAVVRHQRPAAKQQVRAPTLTIAEKYRRPSQMGSKVDQSPTSPEDEAIKPRRRLMQGRKSARTTPTPPPPLSPPPVQHEVRRLKKRPAVLRDDSDSGSESDSSRAKSEPIQVPEETTHEIRLLKFFNECSLQDLTDLSAQTEEIAQFVLDQRPFSSLDDIRDLSNVTETKSGKKSRARPIGDKIVDTCSEVLEGYDAVDELVDECERIAKPIQDALKGWGAVSSEHGEVQLTNLDHDSGIGTPVSSSPGEDPASSSHVKTNKNKGFLGQPSTMSSDLSLKEYQLVGLNWLDLLWFKKLSCILADEMGLGKTCQVISFLAHLQEQAVNGVHLVIVPGSTLENWLREFEKFAPKLKVIPYYGDQSERAELRVQIEKEFDTIDVIVTTIDVAVKDRDNEFLRRHVDPLVCVFDEAHALKNTDTQRYKKLSRIPATFRILLTGTPLQNNLQELIAILAFIMPDLFKAKREELQYIFKHKASTKNVNNAALLSTQRIARARSMMTPFVLRRRKAHVLELPPKHNRVEYCDMLPAQAKHYNGLVQKFLTEDTKRSSNMLMALRQAALHPLLCRCLFDDNKIDKIVTQLMKDSDWVDNGREKITQWLLGNRPEKFKGDDFALHRFCQGRNDLRKFELKKRQWMDAGKIVKFQELVEAFKANGDRVLVFSQFTSMMDILEAVLETLNIKFMRIDGSTSVSTRQDMIDHFTNDSSITVFMLSTKSGGQGINLPCANKVIIFDSGFNPQEDIQAENRAHRVGQTRPVEVFRLVTRETIEEQIQAMGEYKLELGERVAEGAVGEEKQVEDGEQMVAKMLRESLTKGDQDGDEGFEVTKKVASPVDLKDAFKSGLEDNGVTVSSKQAQF